MIEILCRHKWPLLLLTAASVLAGLAGTRYGVNYGIDSLWYVLYAQGLQHGQGLSAPISSSLSNDVTIWINQWPPLYPILLSLGGTSILTWGYAITMISLLASVLLTYALGLIVIQRGQWVALLPPLLFLALPSIPGQTFSFVMTEPPFVAAVLGGLVLLAGYSFGNETRLSWALGAAVLLSAATMLRYIGVAFVIAAVIYLVLWARSVRQPRRWWPLAFLLLALAPLLLYSIYLLQASASLTGVQTVADATEWKEIPTMLRVGFTELLHGINWPFRLVGLESNWWGFLFVVPFAVGTFVYARRQRIEILRSLDNRHLLLIFAIVAYASLFAISAMRSGPIIAEDTRHYAVFYPMLLILFVSVFSRLRLPRYVIGGLLALYFVSGITNLAQINDGLAYNASIWKSDSVITRLPDLIPANALVHGQDVSYLAYVLDNRERMFGGDYAFEHYACDDIVYPDGYAHAAFTLMNSRMFAGQPREEVEAFMREWSAPCGNLEMFEMSDFTIVAVVRLK